MECELCGMREASKKARIEGVVLSVCERCARFGEEVREIAKPSAHAEKMKEKQEIFEEVPVENFGEVVKELREKRNLTQEELAAKIKEKLSVIKRIEEGWIPEENVVRKLERFFGVKLTEKIAAFPEKEKQEKEEALTIGDVVEVRA